MFALIVYCKECIVGGNIWIKDGQGVWVTEGEWGPESSTLPEDKVPGDPMLFKTEKAAIKFAKSWTGHPWWVTPSKPAKYKVIELVPVYKQCIVGYKVKV